MTKLKQQLHPKAVLREGLKRHPFAFCKQKIQRKARPDRFREGHAQNLSRY
jgi:hypothetical protein